MILFWQEHGPGVVYVCEKCGMHLAPTSLLESEQYQGNSGPAILVKEIWNYRTGPVEEKLLRSGQHTIQDTFCKGCDTKIGWGYVRAYPPDQRFKEGKFILELKFIKTVSVTAEISMKPPSGRFVSEAKKARLETKSKTKDKDMEKGADAKKSRNNRAKNKDKQSSRKSKSRTRSSSSAARLRARSARSSSSSSSISSTSSAAGATRSNDPPAAT